MSHELSYTSAPKGLQPGSRGFCTVVMTQGLPKPLLDRVEALSGYKPLFPPSDPQAGRNPVVYSHLRVSAAGRTVSVLSRICAAGLDYSERTNKFAHHVILEPGEQPPAGPAWVMRQPGVMDTQWDGEVCWLPAGRPVPTGDAPAAVCRTWQQMTGDAGWAGVVAEAFEADPSRPVVFLFEPGMDLLPLFDEALRLLSPAKRWEVTFSTYAANVPQGVGCTWRGLAVGTPEAKAAERAPGALILNLTEKMASAKGGGLVEIARTGRVPGRPVLKQPEPVAWTEPRRPAAAGAHERPDARPAVVAPMPIPAGRSEPIQPMPRQPAAWESPPRGGSWLGGFGVGVLAGVVAALIPVAGLYAHFGTLPGLRAQGPQAAPAPSPSDAADVLQQLQRQKDRLENEALEDRRTHIAEIDRLNKVLGDSQRQLLAVQADLDAAKAANSKSQLDELLKQRAQLQGELKKAEAHAQEQAAQIIALIKQTAMMTDKQGAAGAAVDLPDPAKKAEGALLLDLKSHFGMRDEESDLLLRLRGALSKGAKAIPSNSNIAVEAIPQKSSILFNLRDKSKEKDKDRYLLARIYVEDGKLLLDWNPSPQRKAAIQEAWDIIRTCLVEIALGERKQIIALIIREEVPFTESKNLTLQGVVNGELNKWKETRSLNYPVQVGSFDIEMEKATATDQVKTTKLNSFVAFISVDGLRVELAKFTAQ